MDLILCYKCRRALLICEGDKISRYLGYGNSELYRRYMLNHGNKGINAPSIFDTNFE